MVIKNPITSEIADDEDTFAETVGVVVKTPKECESNKVGVFIPKLMPALDVNDKAKETYISLKSDFIKNSKVKKISNSNISLTNYIELYCEYPSGLAMPDFQQGDKVFVKFIDQDMKTLYCKESPIKVPGKKEGERVRMSSPAKKKGSDENAEFSKSNEYGMEIDTREGKQRIMLFTTKLNGEKTAFNMSFDNKNGVFFINAGNGEEIFKYSAEDDEWLFKTAAGSTFSMKDNVFSINCEEFKVNAKTKIAFETDQYQLKTNKLTEEGTTVKKKYQTLNQEGNSGTFKIQNEKHEGLSMRFKHTIGFQVESVISAFNGLIMAAQLSFGSGPPSIDVPISCPPDTMKIDKGNIEGGSMNTNVKQGNMNLGIGAQSLAKANPINNALIKLAAFYDILTVVGQATLVKAFGVQAQITSDTSISSSTNTKGQ